MTKFTVSVATARGGFDDLEPAKIEAMRLAKLNEPNPVRVENDAGEVIMTFLYDGGDLKMTDDT